MDFNDFRFYCAKQGLFTMNKQQQVMLKVKDLIESLCPSEVVPAVMEKSDVEKAYEMSAITLDIPLYSVP